MICVCCLMLAVVSCTWVYVLLVIISVFNMQNVLCSDVECGFIKLKYETVHITL